MNANLRQLLQDALDELEEHEWSFSDDHGLESICCKSCGAYSKERGTYGILHPEHHSPGCTFDSVLIRLRKMLKDETPEENPKQADEA
jgi:hypothetical protein